MPLVESFLGGQNGLLFAYGNTNAGKTYTIQGTKSEPGLLPRILETVFTCLPPPPNAPRAAAAPGPIAMDPSYRYAVWASYLEVRAAPTTTRAALADRPLRRADLQRKHLGSAGGGQVAGQPGHEAGQERTDFCE